MSEELRLVMVGPQGSGKGTQAQVLARDYNLVYISTGAIFRQSVADETDLGKKIKDILKEGNLVPDEVTNELIVQRLRQPDCSQGFVLDGYPRNLVQAKYLYSTILPTHVFEIWISDQEAVERIAGRRMCGCGATYHIKYNPPKQPDICDVCGKSLFVREDDTVDSINRRLEIYHRETEPVLDFFKSQNIHFRIDGMQPIPAVTKDIKKIINGAS